MDLTRFADSTEFPITLVPIRLSGCSGLRSGELGPARCEESYFNDSKLSLPFPVYKRLRGSFEPKQLVISIFRAKKRTEQSV